MKNYYLLQTGLALLLSVSLICLSTSSVSAQHNNGRYASQSQQKDGIQFFVGTWDQAIEIAFLMKKPIFVNVYKDYLPACKKMQKEVFNDYRIAKQYERSFVNYKVNVHSETGVNFMKEYGIREYPALLYFDYKGNLKAKEFGLKTPQQFSALGNEIANKVRMEVRVVSNASYSLPEMYTNYLDQKIQYDNGARHPDFLHDYALQLKKFNDPYEGVVDEYLQQVGASAITVTKNLKFTYAFADNIDTKSFELLLKNKRYYIGQYGSDKVNKKLRSAIRTSIITAANNKDRRTFNRAIEAINMAKLPDSDEFAVAMMATYYESVSDWSSYSSVIIDFIEKQNRLNTPQVLNDASWKFAMNIEDKSKLSKAEKWMEEALKAESNNAEFKETYAAVLYRLGKKSKAMKEAETAVELGRKAGKDYSSTLSLMESIRSSRPIAKDLR